MGGLNSRKQDAERDAKVLVATLKGTGWKSHVWENMGWHYKAVSGPVQVYPSGTGNGFWCMIGSEPGECVGGAAFWTPQRNRTFKDPNHAIKDAMRHVYAFTERIKETVAMAERATGKANGLTDSEGTMVEAHNTEQPTDTEGGWTYKVVTGRYKIRNAQGQQVATADSQQDAAQIVSDHKAAQALKGVAVESKILAAVVEERDVLRQSQALLVEALRGVAIMLNTELASFGGEPWAQRVRAALGGK